LEEPPTHAIFLLATTEIHKIPDTILSRVIRFDLTKIGEADMRGLLHKICTQEGITYEEEALNMIINRSRGSLRDSLTMLEKCIFEKSLQTSNVENALHLVNHAFLKKTFEAVKNGKSTEIQDVITTLESESADIRQFSAQMTEWIVDHIEESFKENAFPVYREIFDLFTQIFIQSKQVAVPMDILRMALYERITDSVTPVKKITKIEPEKVTLKKEEATPITAPEITAELPSPHHELPTQKVALPEPEHELPAPRDEIIPPISNELNILFSPESYLKKIQELGIKTTLLPLLRTATITLHSGEIIISTTSFGKGRCEETATYIILSQAATIFGADKISIVTISDTMTTEVQTDSADIARAIFE